MVDVFVPMLDSTILKYTLHLDGPMLLPLGGNSGWVHQKITQLLPDV